MSTSTTGTTNFTSRTEAGNVFWSDMLDAKCSTTDDCYFQCFCCCRYCQGGSLFRAIQIITLVFKPLFYLFSHCSVRIVPWGIYYLHNRSIEYLQIPIYHFPLIYEISMTNWYLWIDGLRGYLFEIKMKITCNCLAIAETVPLIIIWFIFDIFERTSVEWSLAKHQSNMAGGGETR